MMQRLTVCFVLCAGLLAGCGSPAPTHHKAPIVEYGASSPSAADNSPVKATGKRATVSKVHVVQKGDTLYSIAFANGLDYREVARLNGLADPAAIKIGQTLRLEIPSDEEPALPSPSRPSALSSVAPKPGDLKTQPKVGRLIYTEQALAKAERLQREEDAVQTVPVPVNRPPVHEASVDAADEQVEWGMPTQGKVIAGFSETENRKGIDIAGKRNQAVFASADGKVVYSGSGLRGYGKLIIIKHNKTFLSAYAHNEHILVKEGQSVRKGQKIAEMGDSDADQVKLHFEIRKLGKPVDPAKYLPLVKS
ncbi:MAG: peptidoglycan DD-metalloendopeptidase family protein [Sideroxydans sp.]